MLLTPIPGECFRSPVDRHEGFAALWQSLRVPDLIKNWGAARKKGQLTSYRDGRGIHYYDPGEIDALRAGRQPKPIINDQQATTIDRDDSC